MISNKISPHDTKLFQRVKKALLEETIFEEFENILDLFDGDGCPSDGANKYSRNEAGKIYKFLDVLLKEPVMQFCRSSLQQSKHFTGDWKDFRKKLFEIWFHLHGEICAFERTFSGKYHFKVYLFVCVLCEMGCICFVQTSVMKC